MILLRTSVALTCRKENPETPDRVSESCRRPRPVLSGSFREPQLIKQGRRAFPTTPVSGASSASPGLQPCTPLPLPLDVGRCSLKRLKWDKLRRQLCRARQTNSGGPHRRYGPAHTQRAGSPPHTGRKPAPQLRQVNRVSAPTQQRYQ